MFNIASLFPPIPVILI